MFEEVSRPPSFMYKDTGAIERDVPRRTPPPKVVIPFCGPTERIERSFIPSTALRSSDLTGDTNVRHRRVRTCILDTFR